MDARIAGSAHGVHRTASFQIRIETSFEIDVDAITALQCRLQRGKVLNIAGDHFIVRAKVRLCLSGVTREDSYMMAFGTKPARHGFTQHAGAADNKN